MINQKIRTIRVLDELIFFSIDNNETEPFEGSAELFFNQILELNKIDFFQILNEFDFLSTPNFFCGIPKIIKRCRKMCLFIKILCCELFFGFYRLNFVVYSTLIFFYHISL